jgi:antirestriction protein ArdC
MQKNKITGLEYNGKNVLALLQAKELNGFNSDEWLTFLQAKQNGLKVKKGSKGTKILKVIDDKDELSRKFTVRTYTVFNFEQVETV